MLNIRSRRYRLSFKSNTMKQPRLFNSLIFCLLSLFGFSQNLVSTTPTDWFSCTGTATLDATNVDTMSIIWQEIATLPSVIPSGFATATDLCEGSYMVTFSLNGITTTENFNITTPLCIINASISGSNPSDSVTCDGSAQVIPLDGTAPFTYNWIGTTSGDTTPTISNLCPGNYCCLIMDANMCHSDMLCVDLLNQTPNGDTLFINGGSSCLPALSSLVVSLEDCSLDYNAVDTAYVTNITLPSNPLDSTLCTWSVVDTTGLIYNYSVYYTYMNTACYELQLQLYCYQKSSNIKTLILTQGMYLDYTGIDELLEHHKQLSRVVHLMGREPTTQPTQLSSYLSDDGSIEKVYIGNE